MLNLSEIYKPNTLQQALEFVQSEVTPLAGGTELLATRRKDILAVVDLSGLALDYIREEGAKIAIGATTKLNQLATSPVLRSIANGVIAEAAHRTTSSLLRNQGTLIGTLVAEPAGVLATVMVGLEATVILHSARKEPQVERADEFLAKRKMLLKHSIATEVRLQESVRERIAAIETVGRTPSDKPIVTVCVSLSWQNGIVQATFVAVGGVASESIRAGAAGNELVGQKFSEDLIAAVGLKVSQGVNPQSDYRGSSEYRKEMARILTVRGLRALAQRLREMSTAKLQPARPNEWDH